MNDCGDIRKNFDKIDDPQSQVDFAGDEWEGSSMIANLLRCAAGTWKIPTNRARSRAYSSRFRSPMPDSSCGCHFGRSAQSRNGSHRGRHETLTSHRCFPFGYRSIPFYACPPSRFPQAWKRVSAQAKLYVQLTMSGSNPVAPGLRRAWILHVLTNLLGYPADLLAEGQTLPAGWNQYCPNGRTPGLFRSLGPRTARTDGQAQLLSPPILPVSRSIDRWQIGLGKQVPPRA